jgi:hypothetical protein
METYMDKPLGWEFTKEGWSADLPFVATENQILISMMTGYGDLKKVWNAANQDEVEDAKRSFNHLVKDKKYLAFRVNADGSNGEQMREWDPTAGKMVLVPPIAGG